MTAIEHRDLRSALDFAVLIASEGQKRRPPLSIPKELKPFLGKRRLAATSLGKVRRVVEANPEFRAAISAGALPELVDEVGRLWLEGRPGWETRAAEIIAERSEEELTTDLRRDLKRAEKRRVAAERATARVQAELLQRDAAITEQARELDELRADLTKAAEALEEAQQELIDVRNEVRHARDREAAAVTRAEAAASQSSPPPERRLPTDDPTAVDERDARLRAERRLAEIAEASREFVERVESLTFTDPDSAPTGSRASATTSRSPLRLPGGLISTSAAAARHLLTRNAPVLVDGYNVAKLAWPGQSLEQQRDMLIARCENLARRHSATLTVVFDGDSVPGAHAPARRSIRVLYSPAGTTADDVIRAEVDHLPADTAVVVVTDDREIIDDVRASGANVVASNAFIAIL